MLSLAAESRAIVRQCHEISYFSRNNTYEDILLMPIPERDILAEFLNARLEEASKMQNPVF